MLQIFYRSCVIIGQLMLAVLLPLDCVHARTFSVLYTFKDGNDGAGPLAGLIADGQNNLYGTTFFGGGTGCQGDGGGTVFKLSPDGTETVLHALAGGSDGCFPVDAVVADGQGNLYGTTSGGGSGKHHCGCGIVFEVTPNGAETVIHTFHGLSNAYTPYAGLIMDKRGNLYGTTAGSGLTGCCGTVFRLGPRGGLTILHAFTGIDGIEPQAGLLADSGGNLYGTATSGGANNDGTVFRLASDGTVTVLHSFSSGSDGRDPQAGLIADKNGNLFGTTAFGGVNDDGIIFKLWPDRTETVLYTFAGGKDGSLPYSSLLADRAGNLYGTASTGANDGCIGSQGCGTVFKLAPDGTETTLHVFTGGSDGGTPKGNLIADSQGNLYGTTSFGGSTGCDGNGCGTVFKIAK